MLKRALIIAIAAIILCPPHGFAAEIKIGVIDMQRALGETEDGKAALQKLKAKLDADYKVLQARQEELKKLEDEIAQQGYMLSESAKTQKQDKLRQMIHEFEKAREEKNKEFVEAQKEATGKILKKLDEIIKNHASSEGLTIIFESSAQSKGMPGSVVWYDKKLDVTDKVIELYNGAATDTKKPR